MVLTTGFTTLGWATGVAGGASSPAELMLAQDLLRGVAPFNQTFHVYHYFNLDPNDSRLKGPKDRARYADKYIADVAGRFWNLNYRADEYINAGPGVYVANDPLVSSPEMKKTYFGVTMIELTIPQGSRRLNVANPIKVSSATLKALEDEGAFGGLAPIKIFKVEGDHFLFTRDSLKNATLPGFERLRSMIQNFFRENQIVVIEYNWTTALEGFCRRPSYQAFVLVGDQGFAKTFVTPAQVRKATEQEAHVDQRAKSFKSALLMIKTRFERHATWSHEDIVANFPDQATYLEAVANTYQCVARQN